MTPELIEMVQYAKYIMGHKKTSLHFKTIYQVPDHQKDNTAIHYDRDRDLLINNMHSSVAWNCDPSLLTKLVKCLLHK